MDKKIVSFVLATVLSVGLGVGSAFSAYDEYAQEFNKSYGDGNTTKTIMVGATKSNELVGNITTMFNYYAGTLVSATSAGGSVTLYDSSGARFSVTDVGNSWNATSVNFKASDFDVAEMRKAVDEATLSSDEIANIEMTTEAHLNAEKEAIRNEVIEKARTDAVAGLQKNDGETDEDFETRKKTVGDDAAKAAETAAKAAVDKYEANGNTVDERKAAAVATALKNKKDEAKADWFSNTLIKMGVNPQGLKQIATDTDTGVLLSANTFSNTDATPQVYKWTTTDADGNEQEHVKVYLQGDYKPSDGTGNYLETHISGEFIDKLIGTLNSGINMSASVSIGDTFTGPTLSVLQNGKVMAAYQSDSSMNGGITPTALYRYDNKGFMTGVESVSYNATKTDSGFMTLESTINYTQISYNGKGVRTDTAYQFSKFSTNPEKTLKEGKVGTAVKVEEKTTTDENGKEKTEEANPVVDQLKDYDALKVTETKYTANNSILSNIDYTSGNTTYYGGDGRPRYVNNDQGTTIGVYNYTSNGVISSYFNAEGRDSSGNKVGTTTFFDEWGRQLFSAVGDKDLSSNRTSLVAEYEKGLKDGFEGTSYKFEDGEARVVEGSGTTITNVQIYADQILDKNNQTIMTNGYIDMKKVNSYVTNSGVNVNSILNKNINTDRFGFNAASIQKALSYSNGPGNVLFQVTLGTAGTLTAEEIIEGGYAGEDLKETTTSKTETVGTVSESMGTHRKGQVVGSKTVGTDESYSYSVDSYKSITYSGIVFFGGAAAYGVGREEVTDVKGAKKEKVVTTNVNAIVETDPAVEGTLFPEGATEKQITTMAENLGIDTNDVEAMNDLRKGFYIDKENGKTYAIVNASSINIMDGSGFQVAQGETVFVEINAETRNTIDSNIQKTGDRKIMFMGDVREGVTKASDTKGYLTMTMNTSYGEGFRQGDEAVKEAKNEIMLVSIGVAVANGADIGELQDKLESYNKINETDFTMENATRAYEETKANNNSENSWIIANTNKNMDLFNNQTYSYRAGWDLLLGKAVLTTSADENKTPALF